MLSRCAAEAGLLAEAAGKLAEKFDQLCTMADKALSDSQLITGNEIQARDALKAQKNTLLAEQANLTTLQERLAKLVGDLRLEYNEAKGKLEKTEDRAFGLAITGAIMQPLGQAIGGAGQAVAMVYGARANPLGALGGGSGGSSSAPAPAPAPAAQPQTRAASAEDQRRLADAQAAVAAAELDLQVLEADEKTLDATIAVDNEWLQALPTRARDADERRQADAALRTEIGQAQRDLDTTKSEKARAKTKVESTKTALEGVKAAMQALGVAVTDAGKNLSALGNDYMRIAESQRETVNELFKTLIAKQDKEREILGKVKEAALRLENISLQVDSAEVTISALFQVIAALKQVVAILHEARLFWRNMETACKALAAPAFLNDIKQNMTLYPTDDRVDLFYNEDGFRLTLLNYLAKWRALEVIAGQYIEATKTSRDKILQDFKTLLVGEKARDKVKQLSKDLVLVVNQDVEKLNAEQATVKNAQQLLAAA
jgi:chromosome segregation ATPase